MIKTAFNISIQDFDALRELKNSHIYREYRKAVYGSPLYMALIKDNIEETDSTEDIKKIIDENKLTASELNNIFKRSMSKLVIGLVADSIILQELSSISINDVKEGLDKNFKVEYLLGLADSKYYKEAEKKLAEKMNKDSVMYRGLIAYYKRTGKSKANTKVEEMDFQKPDKIKESKIEHKREISIKGDNLEL